MRGSVVSFDNGKGYGFISRADGSGDIFCHHTEIDMPGFRTLTKGQDVDFEVGKSDINGKDMAVNIRPIGAS